MTRRGRCASGGRGEGDDQRGHGVSDTGGKARARGRRSLASGPGVAGGEGVRGRSALGECGEGLAGGSGGAAEGRETGRGMGRAGPCGMERRGDGLGQEGGFWAARERKESGLRAGGSGLALVWAAGFGFCWVSFPLFFSISKQLKPI